MARIWTTFTAKKSNGSDVKLKIQDLPSDRLDEVIEFFEDYYINNDEFYKLFGVTKNPEAVKESTESMKQIFKAAPPSIVVCCEDNGDAVGEIVGASATGIATEKVNLADFNFNFKTKEVGDLYAIFFELLKLYDVFKGKGVNRTFDDRGLAVNKDYGVDVIKELLNVRRKLCKDLNIPLTVLWAMSDNIQKAAEADGWETAFEISRDDVGKQLGITISAGPASYKVMIGKAL